LKETNCGPEPGTATCGGWPGAADLPAFAEKGLPMTATDLLRQQHAITREIIKKLEAGDDNAIFHLKILAADLVAHMAIEHEIFYPAAHDVLPDLVREARDEHSLAEFALKRLIGTMPCDDAFQRRVAGLKAVLEHHFAEEEAIMFPKMEKTLGRARLMRMGDSMAVRCAAIKDHDPISLLAKGVRMMADKARSSVSIAG
jgi:iron-sulfur cluster repair protein YtfE (RIC family)